MARCSVVLLLCCSPVTCPFVKEDSTAPAPQFAQSVAVDYTVTVHTLWHTVTDQERSLTEEDKIKRQTARHMENEKYCWGGKEVKRKDLASAQWAGLPIQPSRYDSASEPRRALTLTVKVTLSQWQPQISLLSFVLFRVEGHIGRSWVMSF